MSAYHPAGHNKHSTTASYAYRPGAQSLQCAALLGAYFPTGQAAHAVSPTVAENFPGAQSLHFALACWSAYHPAGHNTLLLEFWCLTQNVLAVPAAYPLGQSLHAVLASPSAYRPRAQCLHAVAPDSAEKFPGAQFLHAALASTSA